MRKTYANHSGMIRALALVLSAVMMLSFVGCGNSDTAGGESVVYELPVGAESEYALYTMVVDYLNNGFHPEDLKAVLDLNLTIAFHSKCNNNPEEILTLGMKYDEASALVARLREKAAKMDFLMDDGKIDMDYIDYDAFISEFPEPIRSQLDPEDLEVSGFGSFIRMILYWDEWFPDGKNPFNTDQTVWEKKSETALETYEYDDYKDWDKDLFLNFPRLYGMELGTYISEDDATSMSIIYTVIDGRYYFIDFSSVVSAIGC